MTAEFAQSTAMTRVIGKGIQVLTFAWRRSFFTRALSGKRPRLESVESWATHDASRLAWSKECVNRRLILILVEEIYSPGFTL